MPAAPHRQPFNPYPLAQLAACFACGVLLAHAAAHASLVVWLAACALASVLAAAAFARARLAWASALVCAAFLLAGACFGAAGRRDVPADRLSRWLAEGRAGAGEAIDLKGVVARAPEVAPEGYFVALEVEAIRGGGVESRMSGAVELFAPVRDLKALSRYEALELRRGARVRVLAELRRADEFRNPGVESRTEFLERRGFDAVGTIKSPLLLERLDDEPVVLPLYWLDVWRASLHARLTETFSIETAGILQAAILGNRHGLSRVSGERFREGGTFHILVISGLHISFVGGLTLLAARRLTRRRGAQFAASVVLLWAYAVAVGAEVSVVRAALMFTLVALAPLCARRGETLNALGGACLALLAWRPAELFDPSFQLTFLSVLGIVALGWPLAENLRAVGAWRPTREMPHPPACPAWWRALGEILFWSERAWRKELARQTHAYKLFKTPAAATLERWRVQRVVRYLLVAVLVSLGTQVVLLPLQVVYFHRLSPASLALNIVVGLSMAVGCLGALLTVLAASVSATLAAPLAWCVERACWLMTHAVDPFSRAGLGSLRLPEYDGPAAAIYAFYYLPLAFLLVALARWRPLSLPVTGGAGPRLTVRRMRLRRVAWAALAAASVVIICHPHSAPRATGRLRVDFLDVGQGDAALLTFPDGATLLVDAGGRPRFGSRVGAGAAAGFERDARSVGERVVSEFLWRRGLSRVDYLLATHAHADHVEGLRDVARNFQVRAALAGRAPAGVAEFDELSAALDDANVPVWLVARGDTLRLGGATLEVLWPPPQQGRGRSDESLESDAPQPSSGGAVSAGAGSVASPPPASRESSGNDDSVVLRVRYGERCFLLTGDIERAAEAALVAAGDELRCDVVKVAHHGSQTSSSTEFVAAARARYAVIPVGLDSPYGHPEAGVVARWRGAGAEVLQTGRRGAITFSTDGRDLRVETFVRE